MDGSTNRLRTVKPDTRTHDLAWLLTDAIDLLHLQKCSSAILLIIGGELILDILIDAVSEGLRDPSPTPEPDGET